MTLLLAPETRILTSAAFRRARLKAAHVSNTPAALVDLLAQVERTCERHPELLTGSSGLDLDIICAVVEAHLEDTRGPRRRMCAVPGPRSITGSARLRLVVAALLYLVDTDDLIPDDRPDGMRDDIVLLRWASRMARAELPAA